MKIRQITEQQVDEIAPALAAGAGIAGRWVLKWAIKKGGVPLLRWLAKKAIKWGLISAGVYTAADWTWDAITDIIGEETAQWLMDNKVEIAVVVTIIVAGVALKNYLVKKLYNEDEKYEMVEMLEAYKQKAGDYAKGNAPMPKKKKRGPHPLGGKLVGETATAGATSASAMATVINPNVARYKFTKRGKYGAPEAPQKKNKDGTVANALDMSNNIMGGKPIKR